MKPQKGFSANVGDYSLGISGPDQLEKDLQMHDRMFDPNATHESGAQGGIALENLQTDVATKINQAVQSESITQVISMTQDDYDIITPDPNILYIIVENIPN